MIQGTDPLDYVANHYQSLLAKYGVGPRAVDWRDEDQMNLRFKALSEIENLNGGSIADVGSGLGDLYGFLQKHGWHGEYTGFELISRFVAIARERHSLAEFIKGISLYEHPEKIRLGIPKWLLKCTLRWDRAVHAQGHREDVCDMQSRRGF